MVEQEYRWESTVRDYELDAQGIVNNATYINYLEQCRNDYIRTMNIDHLEYYKAGYALVVAGIEIKYLTSLNPRDAFYVTAFISSYDERRVHFDQEIRLSSNDKLAAKASAHIACVNLQTGKSEIPDSLKAQLSPFIKMK